MGADRGLKRLALRRLDEVELEPLADGYEGAPTVDRTTTLRDALSLMLTEGSSVCLVRGADGTVTGMLTVRRVSELLSEET